MDSSRALWLRGFFSFPRLFFVHSFLSDARKFHFSTSTGSFPRLFDKRDSGDVSLLLRYQARLVPILSAIQGYLEFARGLRRPESSEVFAREISL